MLIRYGMVSFPVYLLVYVIQYGMIRLLYSLINALQYNRYSAVQSGAIYSTLLYNKASHGVQETVILCSHVIQSIIERLSLCRVAHFLLLWIVYLNLRFTHVCVMLRGVYKNSSMSVYVYLCFY